MIVNRLAGLSILLALGCASPDSYVRQDSHFDSRVWADATNSLAHDPWQLGPALVLVGVIPLGLSLDHQLKTDILDENKRLTQHSGDELQLLMLEASATAAVGSLIAGDHGRLFEVWAETNLVTAGITQGLKLTVQRERPSGRSHSSFPSGHVSFTVSMGAMLSRAFDDLTDDWWGSLGYLFYIPGAITAVERVEQRQHYVSDVAAGAAIGFTVGNLVWNAHYGKEGEHSIFRRMGLGELVPMVDENTVGIGFRNRF